MNFQPHLDLTRRVDLIHQHIADPRLHRFQPETS